ncbi:MAG: efflux RND transporter periplasmic adaptor subunit [Candidatus Latescibacterota bacterium]|nr:efflux RND transporter periplasmic adaptor subunit [Candidatus Latescibacterota bacterium]
MTESQTKPTNGRRKLWLIGGLLTVVSAGAFLVSRQLGDQVDSSVPTYPVQQGEFVISLKLKGGELEAVEAENIVAPRVRGQLKIVELFPEGEQVAVGDLLVQYEQTEFQKKVMDAEQQVESSKADLVKTEATQKAEISKLKAEIKNQEANLRLAELKVERMVFEATVQKEEAQIEARKAELSHQQAIEKLDSQKVVNGAEVKKRRIEIERKERELAKARKELGYTTVNAEKPGLVVYGKMWKGGRHEKIRVGDEIWGGVNVISLPNLSRMQVKTFVNEVDVDKLDTGLVATIKLDALPDPTFHGKITSIASIGREKEGEKNVKVFDVMLEIEEEDGRLKPGMSATSRVIIETIPPKPTAQPDSVQAVATDEVVAETAPLPIYIPLDAIFEKNGRTLVYRVVDGQPEEREVKLGKKNDDFVVVEEGLAPDDRIALRDPTRAADAIGGLVAESEPASPQLP